MHSSLSGEFALIKHLTQNLILPDRADVVLGVGDDCAVLDLDGDLLLLATVDSQVEGVHFTLQTSTPEQIGRKALAVNLSDIAAMGGKPRYALVSLIIPPSLSPTVLDGVYAGLWQEAQMYSAWMSTTSNSRRIWGDSSASRDQCRPVYHPATTTLEISMGWT